jgi:hypothetical protein
MYVPVHRTHDKVGVEQLNVNTGALELTAESLRPAGEEGLAAGVDGEEGRRDESGEGADGKDETTLASDHAGDDELRDLESSVAVGREGQQQHEGSSAIDIHIDLDNVGDILVREVLVEGRLVVALADVVDWEESSDQLW